MNKLTSFQKKYLRGLAHDLNPLVLIGHNGLTEQVIKSIDQTLNDHELIKVKFNSFKEKEQKEQINLEIEKSTGAELAGMIGHVAIFFRRNEEKEDQKVFLPGTKPAIKRRTVTGPKKHRVDRA
ncbi:ribosome assembly RNA-binding protein YhbY [Desulforegula conservatrix]|uniref:ribosome assembly RNA-binding protein YhbY n=1 Tax=Desulforegula conservatrix TaxID=153026 RepID=UPI00040D26D5|nr:ribosome assembly RNA-binding protein YhbY [Desulforegula conservatrix]